MQMVFFQSSLFSYYNLLLLVITYIKIQSSNSKSMNRTSLRFYVLVETHIQRVIEKSLRSQREQLRRKRGYKIPYFHGRGQHKAYLLQHKNVHLSRSHSRNRTKGAVILLNFTPRNVLLNIFVSFYLHLQRTLPAVFCNCLRLIYRIRLV